MDIADERASQAHSPLRGSRKGMPLLYTERLSTPVYSRGRVCPRPGTPPIPPKVRVYGAIPSAIEKLTSII